MPTSETEIAETETEVAEPVYHPKCTGKILGGKNAGKPCRQWAEPGTDRCKFHPHTEKEVEAAQASGDTSIPFAAQKIAARLASTIGDEDLERTDDFPASEEDEYPYGRVEASEDGGEDDDVPEGYVKRLVLDPDTNDYVEKLVRVETTVRARVSDSREFQDPFELGPEYRQGFAARFDYRWSNSREDVNRLDVEQGFVPQRESLDNRHTVRQGAVSMGDLILMKRPKEITAERARELAIQQAEQEGKEFQDFEDEAREVGRTVGVDRPLSFGGVNESHGQFASEDAPRGRPLQAAQQPEPVRKRGAVSFAFPSNPLGRDKVAERHRAAVGG